MVVIGASLCSNIRHFLWGVCFDGGYWCIIVQQYKIFTLWEVCFGGGYWCIIVQQYKIFTCGGFVLVVVIGASLCSNIRYLLVGGLFWW